MRSLWLGMSGRAAIEGAQPSRIEGHLRHKRGHRIPVRIWAVPVRDEHGIVVGVLQSFEDRHQLEQVNRAKRA